MSFLLKIVEGPNKGAEIALVEGVSVTLGKGNDCDIILADPTLPAEPLTLEAGADSVVAGGEPLAPFAVKTLGSTSFAVGPSDAPWGELVWPRSNDERQEASDESQEEAQDAKAEGVAPKAAEGDKGRSKAETPDAGSDGSTEERSNGQTSKRGFFSRLLGIVAAVVVLIVILLIFAKCPKGSGGSQPSTVSLQPSTLSSLVERYGLVSTNRDGRVVLVGDFSSRAERLAATAEAYSAQPGIELDFADTESLKTAVADTLALVGETRLSVADITNRVAVLAGEAANFRRMLEAIAADVPKIANVDVTGVRVLGLGTLVSMEEAGESPDEQPSIRAGEQPGKRTGEQTVQALPQLPICGILTAPYPCLVLRDGRRVLEGAPVGDSVILKIEADSVTLTNSTGRFTWKP